MKIGDKVIYKLRKDGKNKIGYITDITHFNGSLRYKISGYVTGRFLNGNTAWDAMQKKELTVIDTRFCFIQWVKQERIIKILKTKGGIEK